MKIQNALISVSDKSGLKELCTALTDAKASIYSTGGTAAAMIEQGAEVKPLEELTGMGELMGGRVKTLHPHVHGAILADTGNPAHVEELAAAGLPKIDLVVVNFYPFEQALQAVANGGVNAKDINSHLIEHIDIGGPAMVRAAAKNHACTAVLTDPADYPLFIAHLNNGGIDADMRRRLAAKAFVKVAHLDAAIANHFNDAGSDAGAQFPQHHFLHIEKVNDLAYGENPHQPAACYRMAGDTAGFVQLHGPELSYNNLQDAQSAMMAVDLHDAPAAVIVKHSNPCGIAVAETQREALEQAMLTDKVSAYGGIVAFNRPLDEDTAELLQETFWEVVIAPEVGAKAKAALALKERPRLLMAPPASVQRHFTSCGRLVLMQQSDTVDDSDIGKVVSKRAPSEEQMRDLQFAWRAAATVKSNAVVLARDLATVGIGAGQMSRVDSARLACEKAVRAKLETKGSVAASDGFFPFPDGVKVLAKAGITAIIQPGGSKNDEEVIRVADDAEVAMVMTSRRHFRH